MTRPAADEASRAELPGDTERTRLPERVVPFWRISSLLVSAPICLAAIVGAVLSGLPLPAKLAIALVPLVLTAADLAVQPKRRAIFWYAIGEEQIDLQHGWPVVTRTVVPMSRVQHLTLDQGPIARRYRLSQLLVHTAAGVVKFPALDDDEGHRIRQRIADLARIADDL